MSKKSKIYISIQETIQITYNYMNLEIYMGFKKKIYKKNQLIALK